jgi:hypothetical protein
MKLHTVLKASYDGMDIGEGYTRDAALSNGDYQTYYHPGNNKMIFSVAGTHNLRDVGTDLWLAAGALKKTDRYKEADRALKAAKEKYKPAATSVVGHSLGGSIAQGIGSKSDSIKTLNAGYTIGQHTRGEHFRGRGDLVSIFGAAAKHTHRVSGIGHGVDSLAGAGVKLFDG